MTDLNEPQWFFSHKKFIFFDDLTVNENSFYSIDHALEILPEIELSAVDYQKARNGGERYLDPLTV